MLDLFKTGLRSGMPLVMSQDEVMFDQLARKVGSTLLVPMEQVNPPFQ